MLDQPYLSFLFIIACYITFIYAETNSIVDCPNYSYACPKCKPDQKCIYPAHYGCEKSGVPVCKSSCGRLACSVRALPCPKECPFSCKYPGTACCPFLGEPYCEPCNTFAECKVIPCPDACPDNCYYENADTCCPRSGKPVCLANQEQREPPLVTKSRSKRSDANTLHSLPASNGSDPVICPDFVIPCPLECPDDCEYPTDVPCPKTFPPKCPPLPADSIEPENRNHHNAQNYDKVDNMDNTDNSLRDEIKYVAIKEIELLNDIAPRLTRQRNGLSLIKNQGRRQHLPIITATMKPTKYTSPKTSTEKMCPLVYFPCPEECPDSCLRPVDAPCPYAVPGYCPPVSDDDPETE